GVPHPQACLSEVVVREASPAYELVAIRMARVAFGKEAHVRVLDTILRDVTQLRPQRLRLDESYDAIGRVVAVAEDRSTECIDRRANIGRHRCGIARKELAPEHGQQPIST